MRPIPTIGTPMLPRIGWHCPKNASTLVACTSASETDIVRGMHGSREKRTCLCLGKRETNLSPVSYFRSSAFLGAYLPSGRDAGLLLIHDRETQLRIGRLRAVSTSIGSADAGNDGFMGTTLEVNHPDCIPDRSSWHAWKSPWSNLIAT